MGDGMGRSFAFWERDTKEKIHFGEGKRKNFSLM
jgi:hypothetical protein